MYFKISFMQIKTITAIKTKITDCPASHLYLIPGTATAHFTTLMLTVGYVSGSCIVYFFAEKKSRKA